MKLVIYISLTSLLFLGCASQEPDIHFEKPEIQIPKNNRLVSDIYITNFIIYSLKYNQYQQL